MTQLVGDGIWALCQSEVFRAHTLTLWGAGGGLSPDFRKIKYFLRKKTGSFFSLKNKLPSFSSSLPAFQQFSDFLLFAGLWVWNGESRERMEYKDK